MVNKQRTCISCGMQSSKMQLNRIVRTSDGRVELDPRGNIAGRGAYICSLACLEKAIATKRIERSLRVSMNENDLKRIVDEFSQIVRSE